VGELGSLAGSNCDKKKEGKTERKKERDRAGGREGKKERRESERGKGLRKISCGNDRRRGEGGTATLECSRQICNDYPAPSTFVTLVL